MLKAINCIRYTFTYKRHIIVAHILVLVDNHICLALQNRRQENGVIINRKTERK